MAEFINYIIDSPIQPVKTNVLWVKKGVLHYYNKKWIPIAGGGSGNITSPIIDGEGNYSAVLAYSDNKALNINSIALGYNNISRNFAEASFGKYNSSHESDDPSIATLFSVGNGSEEERKNAFEVKENGDIYIGGRVESLQTILYNLENHPLDDKYAILEEQLQNLDAYTKENISILSSNIESNASKIEENTNKISINAANIEDINSYLKELKNHIDVSDSELESVFEKYKTDVDGALIEMSTSITQTAEEIRLEAEKTKKELDGKITEYEASFSITAEEIRAEVSRVETDLDGKITKSNSLISQTADEIRTEVSRVELDINGSIREANSRITQTAEEIKSEVYDIQTTLDGKISENSSKIEQTSEEIKSSVKLEQFNALTGAVDQGFTEVKQSVEGIITTIGDRTGKTTSITEDIEGVTVSLGTVEADIESLKKQSDGAIDTHFGTVAPTLDNEPAVNWDTEELKKEHTGDLYYNNTTGEAFRWSYDPETETYLWVELTDSALTDALEKISKLEVAIDGKVTIFYSEPSNYKEGDLWFVHIDYPAYHFIEGQLLTAIAASDAFDASHWEDKTNFASHAEVTESVTQLNNYIDGAFSDNILTVAEIKQIKEAKKNFESLFSEVKESYSYLVISAAATDSDKTALTEAYNNLTHETNGSYTLLIATIDALIALDKEEGDDVLDIEVVEGLLAEYESAYKLFSKDLTSYYAASAKLTEGIQNYLSSASDYINDVMSDGVLSPIEKEQLLNIWRQIAEEFTANRGIAYNYKLLSISDTEEYIKRTDIYPEASPYHSIYEAYENAYNVVKNIFTAVNEEGKNIWGFDDLSVSTATPEDLTTVYISESLDAYYKTLSPFAEMIAEITIAITDAHEAAKEYVSRLANHLDPKDNISVIGNGVILSTVIGVKSSTDDTFVSAINASNTNTDDLKLIDTTHGRVVYAGGIPSTNNWNDSTTVIYEDGHVKFKSGEIAGDFHIGGNATIADSVSIGETRQAILNKANTLQESLGVGGNTIIDGGLVLSTLLGVVDTEGNLKSVLNASDISKDTVNNHGRIVFAGGIKNYEDWTTAKTLIYEDGYVHFKWGKIDDSVELGTAFLRSVAESEEIDVLSYPQNGTLVPLFQINKDSQGNIISLSVLYDFIANRNVIVHGDTSSGSTGTNPEVAGTLIGIKVNGQTYDNPVNGILTIPDYPTSLEWDNIEDKPTFASVATSGSYNDLSDTPTIPSLEGYATIGALNDGLDGKVDKVSGKSLSTNDFTDTLKTKLEGIAAGAEVNVQSDWNATSGDAFIKNKPTIPTKTSQIAEETNLYFTNARAVSALADTLKDYVTKTALASDLGEYASKEWVNEKGYITGITLTGDDYISVNGYKLSLAIDAQGGLTNTGQGLGIYQIPSAKIVTDALGYTPLSTAGGTFAYDFTLSSSDYSGGLQIARLNAKGAGIRFLNTTDGVIGHIGVGGSGSGDKLAFQPIFTTKGGSDKMMWHEGNFNPADYLPLSGGTISGSSSSVTTPLTINTTYYYEVVAIAFNHKGINRGGVGLYNNGAWLVYGDGPRIGVRKDGKPAYALGYNQNGYELIHSGNYSSYALPLSGGTITSASGDLFAINRTSGNPQVRFESNGSLLGYIGMTSGNAVVRFTDSTYHTLIHSGNIKNYAAIVEDGIIKLYNPKLGGNSKTIGIENGHLYIGYSNVNTHDVQITGSSAAINCGSVISAIFNSSGNVTIGASDLAGTSAKLWVNGSSFFNADGDATTPTYVRFGAKDFGLQIEAKRTGNTHFQSRRFDSTTNYYNLIFQEKGGNVLIGTTTDNGAKLQVEGYVSISNNNGIYFKDKEGTIRSQLYVDQNNNTSVGYGAMQTSGNTALYGTYLRFMTSGSDERMRITNSGNVLIGTTTDNGAKLQVNGYASFKDEIDVWEGTTKNRLTFYEYQGIGRIYSYNETDKTFGDLWIGNNSGDILKVKADGKIGIGITNPSYKLHVNGDIRGNVLYGTTLYAATGGNGIYLTGSGIYYHNSSNQWVKDLVAFASDGSSSFKGAVTMSSTLKVGGNIDVGYNKLTFATSASDYHIGWGNNNMFVYANYYGHYFSTKGTTRMTIAGDGAVTMSSYLSVGSHIYMPNNTTIYMKDNTGSYKNALRTDSNNLLLLGNTSVWTTVIDGSSIHLRTTNHAYGLFIAANGNVVIGSPTTSDYKLYVDGSLGINGNAVFAGDTATGSDIRFKDKLSDHRIALSDIANAPLFTFKWNDREDDSVHLGSSAQYWEKVAPWLVKGEDFKTLDYSTLGVAIGISLANMAVNHEERIKILEKENKALKEEIRRIQYGS